MALSREPVGVAPVRGNVLERFMATQHIMEWAGFKLTRPLVMGILNVTPDSFSDGGRHFDSNAAIEAGRRMMSEGADILDIGGESTRPGALPVDREQEIARILPVIQALAAEGAVISLDTRNAATMEAGLKAGARIINDVSAFTHDKAALGLVAQSGCPVILMHMRGTPATMNEQATYQDVARDVAAELACLCDAALAAGVSADKICLDPGFGFAKRGDQNVSLLKGLSHFTRLGYPVLVALSRKRFLGEISAEQEAHKRDPESLAADLYAVAQGAHILRVHDTAGTARALRIWHRLTEET